MYYFRSPLLDFYYNEKFTYKTAKRSMQGETLRSYLLNSKIYAKNLGRPQRFCTRQTLKQTKNANVKLHIVQIGSHYVFSGSLHNMSTVTVTVLDSPTPLVAVQV